MQPPCPRHTAVLRLAQQANGPGMEKGAGLFGLRKDADNVDRIALEDGIVGNIQSIVVNAELRGLAHLAPRRPVERIEQPRQAWRRR